MSKQEQHWEKTRTLLFVTLAIWFVFSIGIFFFATEMNASGIKPFGYPLTYWFTCQGSLGIFVILIFWFAGRQEKIDEEFGFTAKKKMPIEKTNQIANVIKSKFLVFSQCCSCFDIFFPPYRLKEMTLLII